MDMIPRISRAQVFDALRYSRMTFLLVLRVHFLKLHGEHFWLQSSPGGLQPFRQFLDGSSNCCWVCSLFFSISVAYAHHRKVTLPPSVPDEGSPSFLDSTREGSSHRCGCSRSQRDRHGMVYPFFCNFLRLSPGAPTGSHCQRFRYALCCS